MIIHKSDNVEVNISNGHKYARNPIKKGEPVIKYGNPIGYATKDIQAGDWVHTHNLVTALSGDVPYTYTPVNIQLPSVPNSLHFMGYRRPNGDVGIRNDIWIVVTVGCVNKIAERIAGLTGAYAFTHPYGCSQLGDDHTTTQKILRGLVNHPNCGGVLVLGLGCENNNIDEFQKILGAYDPHRVKFLNCQDAADEISEGIKLINALKEYASGFKAEAIPISKLRVGLKCGGSDGFSGITANPLVGRFSDRLIAMGGSCILSEVPEMFGAEHLLMERCIDQATFDRTVDLISNFKNYYKENNQPVYENPSPGNKAGGITTLEEKSLGCVQKAGNTPVTDVLDYGDTVKKSGLSLLNGPGNDMVAVTNLTAAGAHLILFTTGRGTPLGAPVPTVKIATNRMLAETKSQWIDIDASPVLEGKDLDDAFFRFVVDIASGAQTKNEIYNYREIAIFKNGVTL